MSFTITINTLEALDSFLFTSSYVEGYALLFLLLPLFASLSSPNSFSPLGVIALLSALYLLLPLFCFLLQLLTFVLTDSHSLCV